MVYAAELGVRASWDDSKMQAGMHRTESDIRGFISNVKGSISQGIGQALGQMGFASVKDGVRQLVSGMIDSNAQFEDFNTQFEVMLGSAEKAKSFYKELNDFAMKTPFEMPDLSSASQTLLAFGIDAQKIMPSLRMIGDVSLGNKEKFKGLTLAFAQVQATGRLMGQDLLQMVDRGFNPLTIISQKTGVSMADLKKKMEDGAISADMVTNAFEAATSKGGRFYQGMEKGSQTFNGLKSTAVDLGRTLMREYGEKLFAQAKQGLIKLIDYIGSDKGKATIKNLADMAIKATAVGLSLFGMAKGFAALKAVSGVVSVVSGSLITMAGQTGAMIGMSKAATLAAGAMGYVRTALVALTGPIGIVIAVIGALAAAYATNFAGFRTWVNGMVSDVISFVGEIKGYFDDFAADNKDLVEFAIDAWTLFKNNVATVFKAVMDVVSGAWEIVKTVIRTGFEYISGVVKFWRRVFQGDWEGAWEVAKQTLQKVWSGFVVIVWNAILTILKVLDRFADFFAKSFGMDFTGLDGAMKAATDIISEYEGAIKRSHKEIRTETKKTADETKKAAKDQKNIDWGFGPGKTKEGKGKGRAGSSQKDSDELTGTMLQQMARSITTKNKASCAEFTTQLLKATGATFKGSLGAKQLMDNVLAAGGKKVPLSDVKPGDLVMYHGRGYGALKDASGKGWHATTARGNGQVISSSGGKVNPNRSIINAYDRAHNPEITVVRPNRGGKYGNKKDFDVEGLKEWNDAQQDTIAKTKAHRNVMVDLWKDQLNGAKESAIFQWEYEKGVYPEMTREQFKQRLEAMQYNETLARQNEIRQETIQRARALSEEVRSYVEQGKQELATSAMTTEKERILWELREGKYKRVTGLAKAFLILTAEKLDKDRKDKAGLQAYKDALKEVDSSMLSLTQSTREAGIARLMLQGMTKDQAEEVWGKQDRVKGLTAYTEKMKELGKEMLDFSANAREAAISQMMIEDSMTRAEAEAVFDKTKENAGIRNYNDALREMQKEMLELTTIGKDWQLQQLMTDGQMTEIQAREILRRKEQIEGLKQYRDLVTSVAERMTGFFMDSLSAMRGGFGNFVTGIVDGFRKMLQDMAAQYIRSQVYKFVFEWLDGLGKKNKGGKGGQSQTTKNGGDAMSWISSIVSIGNAFAGFRESGGHMNARGLYMVGEGGPELVAPNSSSHVFNASDTAAILSKSSSSGATTINLGGIVINGATDHESFKKNQGQMASDIYRMLEKAAKRH
jgi:tape measure domain-containing protein